MRLAPALLASVLAVTATRAVDMINLPVMDQPKSDARPGEFVFNLLPRAFQTNPAFEMSIKCRVTPYGQTFPAPSPQEPVYYIMQDAGRQSLGETSGEEKPPEHLDNILIRALSTNGYRPATDPAHKPALVLIYSWGSHFAMDHEAQVENIPRYVEHLNERSRLIGEFGFRPVSTGSSAELNFYYFAQNSLYFAIISAYDHDSVARGKPELVWRAHLTANAQGVSLNEALPALVLTAGTSFGRDTGKALFVTRRAVRGKVELGPLIFEPDEDPPPALFLTK